MRKFSYLLSGVLVLACLAQAAQEGKAPEKDKSPRTLKVKLNYTGAGKVDAKHQIFVFVFDSPDFVQGSAMPIAAKSASAKDEIVVCPDLTASPVYVAVSYDPTGGYDGQSGPPPSGSSMGIYSKSPGKIDPIEIGGGKTVQVEVTFDDTAKMP